MFEDEINSHEILFSGSSYQLGEIHWYLVRAFLEKREKSTVKKKEGQSHKIEFTGLTNFTEFGHAVSGQELSWWINKKEKNVNELLNRTQAVLISAQILRENSTKLKKSVTPMPYSELINKIKIFTEDNESHIQNLFEYVLWLYKKDGLANNILFTHRVWGSTRISDRLITTNLSSMTKDRENLNSCTEIALGLKSRDMYKIFEEYLWLSSETDGNIHIPSEAHNMKVNLEILDELSMYFELIRQSLRNIVLEIKKYNDIMKLLYRHQFWKNLILKIISENLIENELWDFKKTLAMWRAPRKKRKEKKVQFCEHVTAFANNKGGVLLIGISDKFPRKIIGLDNLENKIKDIRDTISNLIFGTTSDFIHVQQIILVNEKKEQKDCLIIAIAQTKEVLSVKDINGSFIYPIRIGTGISRTDRESIQKTKQNQELAEDPNYKFINTLYNFSQRS